MGPNDHPEGKFAPQWGHPSEPKSSPGDPNGKPKDAKGCPKGSHEGPKRDLIVHIFYVVFLFRFGTDFLMFFDGLGWLF